MHFVFAPSQFLLGSFHGERNLVDYSLWNHKEQDTTQQPSSAQRRAHSFCRGFCDHLNLKFSKRKEFSNLPFPHLCGISDNSTSMDYLRNYLYS